MKNHVKVYYEYFGYDSCDIIECENPHCCREAVDIHHIDARGMGGSKCADNIENLMALCRACHEKYGDKKQYKDLLKAWHNWKMEGVNEEIGI